MKKSAVIIITLILLSSFGFLVWFALTHSRGVPTVIEKPERLILEAAFIDKEISFKDGIALDIWEALRAKEIKLMPQLMVQPWPKNLTPLVLTKSFHNQKDIYFYLEWRDDTEDRQIEINKFSDACGIMFPLKDEVQPATIMMGFIGGANIWQWKAAQDKEFWLKEMPQTTAYADYHYPFEESETLPVSKIVAKFSANDLLAIRAGTVTPKDTQVVEARGFFKEGVWRVVFKRRLKAESPEVDAVFSAGKKRLCGFAVWNGSNGDRGGRKSISEFVELDIK